MVVNFNELHPQLPGIPGIALAMIWLAIFYAASISAYRLLFHPLRAIPGPWYAAVSDLWILFHVLSFNQCHAIQGLVKKYGPIVRIAPNQVAYVDGPTTKIVYGKFNKHTSYLALRLNGNDAAITTLDIAEHARVRKASAGQYIPSNIEKYESTVHESLSALVKRLEHDGGETPFDCLVMFRHLMTEVLVRTNFDFESNAVNTWASGGIDPLTAAVHDTPKCQNVEYNVPKWVWGIIRRVPHPSWQRIVASQEVLTNVELVVSVLSKDLLTFMQFVQQGIQEIKHDIEGGKFDDADRKPLVSRILSSNLEDRLKLGESADHLLAGIDTVATTVSYFCWSLACHPAVMQKLRSELDGVMDDPAMIPKLSTLKTLPYLTAVVQETLRLYGTAPSYLPRVIPDTKALNILGYEIPPGTVIGTSSWSTHRQEDVYPSPETFNPDRWLAPNVIDKSQMIAFGYGSRSCAGENLAQMVLRIIVVTFARYFDIEIPKTIKLDMRMLDGFAGFPAGLEVPLLFKPRLSDSLRSGA